MMAALARLDRRSLALATIALALVLFVALNIAASGGLRRAKLDLTAGGLYTLSPSTRAVLQDIEEPITLRFYFSKSLEEEAPTILGYAGRVRELLQQYTALAEGKLKLEFYSPAPFSPEEDQALSFGLRGVPINEAGDVGFFGLAGTNTSDDQQTIAFFLPDRESSLEYDLTKLVYNLANPEKPSVAVAGILPLASDPANNNLPWLIYRQIGQLFNLRHHDGVFAAIDQGFDVLLLAQPQELSDKELYAIDQYILGGGHALILVDPAAEFASRAQMMAGQEPPENQGQALNKLFAAWGIEMHTDRVVGDPTVAQRIEVNRGGRRLAVPYLPWLALPHDNLDADDAVTRDLERLTFASAGYITAREGAAATLKPLAWTGPDATTIPIADIRNRTDALALLESYKPGGTSLTLAARVTGIVESAFREGAPAGQTENLKPEDVAPHLARATEPINVILVADTDLLFDALWARAEDLMGEMRVTPLASNGDFVVNALDNLRGSNALINLRSRGFAVRPFSRLEELTREAEQRYRAKERELHQKLEDIERKMSDLSFDEASGTLTLSADQFAAIETFRAETLATRRDLRDVQRALREDIEREETRLKAINIGAMPLVIGVLAIGLALARRARTRRGVAAKAAGGPT